MYCPISYITGRREKVKGLEVPCKYYHYGSTKDLAFIQDATFIFVIMLVPSATKQDQAFILDQL